MSSYTYVDTSVGKARWITGADVLTSDCKVQSDPNQRVAIPVSSGVSRSVRITGSPILVTLYDGDSLSVADEPMLTPLIGADAFGGLQGQGGISATGGASWTWSVAGQYVLTESVDITFTPGGNGHFYLRVLVKA